MSGNSRISDELDKVDELINFAKISEQAERYDDMAKAMKKVTEKEKNLTQEYRNLLSGKLT